MLRKIMFRRPGMRIVALGLGSPTALSMSLIRSFCYQLAVCLIVREALCIEHVDVFDPIMDANDVEICRSMVDEYRPDISAIRALCKPISSLGMEDTDDESQEEAPKLLLWMPHCEAELYKQVLLDIEGGKDPLGSAKALAGVEHQSPSSQYDLSNVVVVGNSLTRYVGEKKLPGHIVERVVEAALPDFTPFYQAFSDSYITTFRTV